MACSLSSLCSINPAFCTHNKVFRYPKTRSQSYSDNGKPSNIVDANLSVLRERIQQVRKRERLMHNTCGWNYKHEYESKFKRDAMVSQFAEIMGLASGGIGLVFLIGSLGICLVSLLVHIC